MVQFSGGAYSDPELAGSFRKLFPAATVRQDDMAVAFDWPISEKEEALRQAAEVDLPMLALADDVSRLLAEVIEGISIDATEEDRNPKALRIHALWFMAITALRALRAAMQALRTGYEDQAVGYQRLIDEIHNRAQQIAKDASGGYARQWLEGRGLGKGAKLAGQDFWEFMSGPVHANPRAVLDWIAISRADGSTQIVVGPERRPDVANPALVYMASSGRDIAHLLAIESEQPHNIATLDARIHEAFATWIPDDEGEEASNP